jgi:hypothetical protein
VRIPLDDLVDREGNVYEMTCVAIREAELISSTSIKDDIEKEGDKVVSVVLTKALHDEIKYTRDDEDNE